MKTQTGLTVTDDKLVNHIEGVKGEIELQPISAIEDLIRLSNLPNECETPEEKNVWFSLFDSIGTHIAIAVDSGGKMIERRLINKVCLFHPTYLILAKTSHFIFFAIE